MLLVAGLPLPGLGAEPAATNLTAGAGTPAESRQTRRTGLPPNATGLGRTGSSFVTSSMVVTWIVALGLIVFARSRHAQMKPVPAGAQNFLEWLVESSTSSWRASSARSW